MQSSNFNYSRLTLQPKDASESSVFRHYRIDDVYEQHRIIAVSFTLYAVAQVVLFVFTNDLTTFIDSVNICLQATLGLLIYKFGSHIPKERLQVCITAVDCISFMMIVVSFSLIYKYAETSQSDKILNLKNML